MPRWNLFKSDFDGVSKFKDPLIYKSWTPSPDDIEYNLKYTKL